MPFAGGTGIEGDRFQIATVEHWNSINEEATGAKFKLINDFDAAGQQLEFVGFDDKDIDGQGFSINNIDSVNDSKLMSQGVLSNIRLHFNWSDDVNGLMSPIGLTVLGSNIEIDGSITNTNANGSVAGYAERGFDGSSNISVKANLSAHSIIYGISDFSNGAGVDKAIFSGSMTDLSGSAILVGTQNDPDSSVEGDSTNLFWDRQVSGSNETFDENGGGKTTSELQTLATYTTLYSESYGGGAIVDGSTVSVYPGLGYSDFPFSVGETIYLYGVPYEVASVVNATTITTTTTPRSSIRSVTSDAFGTGDGTTTGFEVTENALKSGTVTIYIDGVSTTAYSINLANGAVTFDTPPANGAALTADYDYSRQIVISQGTGTYRLTEAFDMVTVANYNGSQTWVIDEGVDYPKLGIFIEEVETISGIITYNAAPVEGATVDLISVDQAGGGETVAEAGLTTQADGTVTSSVARDGAKEYYFRVYPFNLPISGLTGTLTATDATNLDLGVDLSALDTGQNRAYTIKATGGTGSGEVIIIKDYTDKANGLVTVDYHPFDNTTTFEVCRLVSGENASVLPRTS